MQNCPPAGRTETPQGFFLYFFFTLRGFFFSFFLFFFFSFLFFLLLFFFICPPPSSALSHLLYIFCVFFLFILLAGRQPALLGVLNTESSTQASDPTRNKFVCVCISTDIWEGGGFFFPSHISVPAGDSNPRRSAHLQPPQCRRAKPLDHENLAIYM